jgi:hypothetical protein
MTYTICMRGALWRLYPCKLWEGNITSGGYGRYYIRGTWPEPKWMYVHREALTKKLGRVMLPEMDALHHCDTPACYESEHLYEGTDTDNTRDRSERGRWRTRYGRPALTDLEKKEIREAYAAGGVSYTKLGLRFDVTHTTIGRVVQEE